MTMLIDTLRDEVTREGPWALTTLALATLVSEDLACIAAGLLVAEGLLPFAPAVLACFAGIFVGDLLLVLLGRTLGRRCLHRPPLQWWVSPETVSRAERWFEQRGASLIFVSRFVPGTRLPTYLAAGILKSPWRRFVGWFALACAVWTPLLVGSAALFGTAARNWFAAWSVVGPAVVAGALLGGFVLRLLISTCTWRGRRLLVSRWRRLSQWEFWPTWAIYLPVVPYVLWLGLKYRKFTLPTAVNPTMGAGGGLVGESKSEILRGLASSGNAVARWEAIEPGPLARRAEAVEAFMLRERLSFPLVLKPDVGERGSGVVIARDANVVSETLQQTPGKLIAQAYVPGVEFGVFYYRRPSAEKGVVFAITDKRMVTVVGDGKCTLEELILGDARAVCMASFFLRRHESRLDTIPAEGETVLLSELGTHCRGAVFLDGTHLVTSQLTEAFEHISRSFEGFHFGRYDVRANSLAAFQNGKFKVIELNGLTSEATSMYDPKHSVWFGWRMLCRQWRIAFEIGAENHALGAPALTLLETYRLVTSRPSSMP